MANRDTHGVDSPKSDVQIINISLKGAGAADMVPQESANGFKSDCVTATRTGAGSFSLAFRHAYAELLAVIPSSRGATAGLKPRISAIDVDAKTASLVVETFDDGTAAAWQTGVTVAADTATLPSAGVVTDVIATTETGLFPGWTTGITVTANAATMAVAGEVVGVVATAGGSGALGPKKILNTGTPAAKGVPVETTGISVTANACTLAVAGHVLSATATTADSAGGKTMQSAATPAAGKVRVQYDAAGVATLTFNTTDNVSVASVVVIPLAKDEVTVTYSGAGVATLTFAAGDAITACAALIRKKGSLQAVKEIIHTGTAGPGQVKVTYSAGVPTLTFNVADHVTVAAVGQFPGDSVAGAVDPGTSDYVDLTLVVRNSKLN